MNDYEWPSELDLDERQVVNTSEFAQIALQRIQEYHRHHSRLREIEQQRLQRHAEIDREFNQDMKRVLLKTAVALTLSAGIIALVAWLLTP